GSFIIVAAAWAVQRLTQHLDRVLGFHLVNHRPFLLKPDSQMALAFLEISNCIVSFPTMRSSSAIRVFSSSVAAFARSPRRTSSTPPCRNSCFHRERRFSLISRSRQI